MLDTCRLARVPISLLPVFSRPEIVKPLPKAEPGSSPFCSRDPETCAGLELCFARGASD